MPRLRRAALPAIGAACAAAVAALMLTVLLYPALCGGKGMDGTVREGDAMLINMMAYTVRSPARGEAVAFILRSQGVRKAMVRRIVGLPGETVSYSGGVLYINGAPVEEAYAFGSPAFGFSATVPEDACLVLCDDRSNVYDPVQIVPYGSLIGTLVARAGLPFT